MSLPLTSRLALNTQRFISWVAYPFLSLTAIFLMRFIGRYRIENLKSIRLYYNKVVYSVKGPLLICSNHHTKIDSAIIICAFASVWDYMRSFQFFPWNLPDRERYESNVFLRVICYLGSCIPVDRKGQRQSVSESMNKLIYLLKKDQAVMLFPEGKRSTTGRINSENFAYGPGRLANAVEGCRVLCVYLRGKRQQGPTSIPRLGEHFYMDLKLIKPKSANRGLRAGRDIASQIIKQLISMEEKYFAFHGK